MALEKAMALERVMVECQEQNELCRFWKRPCSILARAKISFAGFGKDHEVMHNSLLPAVCNFRKSNCCCMALGPKILSGY